MQAFLASALGKSIVAVTAYFRLETWHGAVNKPVLSIILQTRNALVTASSAAITELATTKTAAAAKIIFIENPVPLRRHGARACFVLQDMLHGFAVTVRIYNANERNLFAGVGTTRIYARCQPKGAPATPPPLSLKSRHPRRSPTFANRSGGDISAFPEAPACEKMLA